MGKNYMMAVLAGVMVLGLWNAEAFARGRTYSPVQGRFHQRDPVGTPMASPVMRNLSNVQFTQPDPGAEYADGMNLYQYVQGSPVSYLDPYGLQTGSPNSSQPSCPCPCKDDPGRCYIAVEGGIFWSKTKPAGKGVWSLSGGIKNVKVTLHHKDNKDTSGCHLQQSIVVAKIQYTGKIGIPDIHSYSDGFEVTIPGLGLIHYNPLDFGPSDGNIANRSGLEYNGNSLVDSPGVTGVVESGESLFQLFAANVWVIEAPSVATAWSWTASYSPPSQPNFHKSW